MNETNVHNGAFHLHGFQNKIKQLRPFGCLIAAWSYAPGDFVAMHIQIHFWNKHTSSDKMDNCIRQANCSWNSKVHPVASAHGIEDETKIALNGRFTELPRPRKRRRVVSPWWNDSPLFSPYFMQKCLLCWCVNALNVHETLLKCPLRLA